MVVKGTASMESTVFRIQRVTPPRGVVWGLVCALSAPLGGSAQEADWRTPFAQGDAARAEGDDATYALRMAEAVEAMPPGLLNRPFAQYHAARAHALLGDPTRAAHFLTMAWEEGIEGLMISFAAFDPAFDGVRDDPRVVKALSAPASLRLTATRLAGNVVLLDGAGSKLVASVGSDGVLLVDTGYRPALPALRRSLAELGADRVARLVLTHPHEDHWGAVEDLADEAVVMAHPRTAAALREPYTFMEGVEVPARPGRVGVDVEIASDTTFRFNGEDVRILPMVAHTGGDVLVHFQGSGVVHFGDAWLGGNPMMFPGGEDPDGFLDRMDAFLASLPGGTVVVGGHDAPAGVAAVSAQVDESRACMALVRQALDEGLDRDATVARAEGRFTAPWVRFFYAALSRRSGAG
jgi:glyoxylase-like metal-dependent hydrolase (beta-lactamase superfamily II)